MAHHSSLAQGVELEELNTLDPCSSRIPRTSEPPWSWASTKLVHKAALSKPSPPPSTAVHFVLRIEASIDANNQVRFRLQQCTRWLACDQFTAGGASNPSNKLSVLKALTGNFNSLLSQKNSLFFFERRWSPRRAKPSELCSMSSSAVRKCEPKTSRFPVKFPVSREFGRGERFARDCQHHHKVSRSV
jgi:hypothetical protein